MPELFSLSIFLIFITALIPSFNQTPVQAARDKIDAALIHSGWVIQHKNRVNLRAGLGVAVREYQTDVGAADYILFVDLKPVGIIGAKRKVEGVRLMTHEDQSEW